MMDINKVETCVANAAMANTIEVTTSEGEQTDLSQNLISLICLLILEMAVTLADLQGASKTIGKFNCIYQLF